MTPHHIIIYAWRQQHPTDPRHPNRVDISTRLHPPMKCRVGPVRNHRYIAMFDRVERHPAAGAERGGHDGRNHAAGQGASGQRNQGEGPGSRCARYRETAATPPRGSLVWKYMAVLARQIRTLSRTSDSQIAVVPSRNRSQSLSHDVTARRCRTRFTKTLPCAVVTCAAMTRTGTRKPSWIFLGVSAFAFGAAVPSEAATATTNFTPIADTHVANTRQRPIRHEHAPAGRRLAAGCTPLMRFQVAGLSGTVTTAKLRLYVNNPSDRRPGGVPLYGRVDRVRRHLEQPTVADRREPRRSRRESNTDSWVEYNVTSAVTANGTFDFILTSSSADGMTFHSRERPSVPSSWWPRRPPIPLPPPPPAIVGRRHADARRPASPARSA